MDYQQHSDAYFHPASQPFPIYPNVALPPTPQDEYTSPPVGDHFHTIQSDPHSFLTPKQDGAFNDFYVHPTYEQHPQSFGVKPLTPQSQPSVDTKVHINHNANGNGISNFHDPTADPSNSGQGNSNSDEDGTPQQARRKAQNRAAQRAFRERKDRHVKDLETKLADLERNSASVMEENERLKLQLQKKDTENEILRVTSMQPTRNGTEALPDTGPMRYSPTDFYTEVLYAHDNKTPSHRIVTSENGERLLAAGATWDYIIKHPLYIQGRVDVGNVSEKLKTVAKCDGQGPVFEESAILSAIQLSVASGNDELL